MNRILVTGGAGFIGSHVLRHFVSKYPDYKIVNLDILSYASDLTRLEDIENKENYSFIKGDINNFSLVKELFHNYKIDSVINLAAESHVDKSILDPKKFAETNILGTLNLLNISNKYWDKNAMNRFYQISTDEVYGDLGSKGVFTESSPYKPKSPYSASKASADHLVRSFHHTFNLPILISNCSNNYGPDQYEEKLIPMTIKKIINQKKIPIYGEGQNIRDWIFVQDHVNAIDEIFHKGKPGETYNIGGDNEIKNLDLVHKIIDICDKKMNNQKGESNKLISFVEDRLGHDFRYAIDNTKIVNEIGWNPSTDFKTGLEYTIDAYFNKFNI
jgi:dTDP-glucose 4,6-dehydratase